MLYDTRTDFTMNKQRDRWRKQFKTDLNTILENLPTILDELKEQIKGEETSKEIMDISFQYLGKTLKLETSSLSFLCCSGCLI